jgi:group I intron endonuclease
MNTEEYSIYWIHLPEHTDIKTQGYVGISNNPERRFNEHCKGKNSILSNAIKKYGSDRLVFEVVNSKLTLDEAKQLEYDFRPKMRMGWNIMTGGSVPPSNIGTLRPSHSQRMMGANNPFYGKRHDDKTKALLSEKKSGSNSPNYGKKRPKHSEALKKRKGKDYPKFRGYFITPFGRFDSYKKASEETGITVASLYGYCHSNDKIITNLSYSKNKMLQNIGSREELVGKTYKAIGFGFEYV